MKKVVFARAYGRYEAVIRSEEFKNSHKLKETAFTRTRRFPFCDIIHFICGSRKHGNQAELEMYFTAKGELTVSRQAFAKARELIDPRAFTEISDAIVDEYEKACQTKKTYKGYRLIAVDGSIIDLPDNPRTRLYFGYSTNGTGKAHAKGLAMAAYDVLNRITIFAELYRYDDSEKKKILDIAEGFKDLPVYENALFLLDRGYPSFELFKQFQRTGRSFWSGYPRTHLKRSTAAARQTPSLMSSGTAAR